ncbi:MAG: NTP transferase domain-containing protein [Rhodocyclaceae bacterium]
MIRGILLAAGFGRRFDAHGLHDKLLAPLADGRPLLWHSARALAEALPRPLAVVRPGLTARTACLSDAGCEVLECVEAADGMGHALAAAVRASHQATGWVVGLGDMPWLEPASVVAVAAALDHPQRVAAPSFEGRRGHPVGFGAAWFERLTALAGDLGARALLQDTDIRLLPSPSPGVVRDVDTPADLPTTPPPVR